MNTINENAILKKYDKNIKDIIFYLQNKLKDLDIESALIYGSSTYENVFIEGVSDIDIIAYTDKMSKINPKKIIEIIEKNTNDSFKDKKPMIYLDHIGYRIEFYIEYPEISFDITLLPLSIPNFDKRETDSSYDSLEMIIGSLYKNSIVLFGKIPYYEMIKKDFFPFYNDELRNKRLNILTKRLISYTDRVEVLTKNKDKNLIDHLYKTRNHFLKWLFIFKRKYPVNLSKHIYYQLKQLNIPEKEISILMFLDGKDLYEIANKYLELSRKYFNLYFKEVKNEI